jgi:hypothetical protein
MYEHQINIKQNASQLILPCVVSQQCSQLFRPPAARFAPYVRVRNCKTPKSPHQTKTPSRPDATTTTTTLVVSFLLRSSVAGPGIVDNQRMHLLSHTTTSHLLAGRRPQRQKLTPSHPFPTPASFARPSFEYRVSSKTNKSHHQANQNPPKSWRKPVKPVFVIKQPAPKTPPPSTDLYANRSPSSVPEAEVMCQY